MPSEGDAIAQSAEGLLASAFEAPTPTAFEGRTVLCWVLERGRGHPVFLTLDRSVSAPVALVFDRQKSKEAMGVVTLRDTRDVHGLIVRLQRLVACGRAQ